MITAASAQHRLVIPWIIACLLMVAVMVFVGGVTRLTESGLSIVEWKLLSGITPPFSEQAWQDEFAEYKTSPEYKTINKGMTLDGFKRIYWLEYLHRLLGRATGIIFLAPLILFAAARKIDRPLAMRMGVACVLVALQGTVGWFMVFSGLQDEPRVSPIRLAMHLSLAFIVFGLVLWTYFQLGGSEAKRNYEAGRLRSWFGKALLVFVFIQIIFGALVAGLDAGKIYNTYPLMDGDWVPIGLTMFDPWWANFVKNTTMVQFAHRMMALVVVASIVFYVAFYWKRSNESERNLMTLLCIALILQFGLGILTLIHVVPIHLASAHQMFALVLYSFCLALCYRFPRTKAQS